MRPSCVTSRHCRVSVPAWGTIPEWYCSTPEAEARHWKKSAPSEPCAMCCRLWRVISPGAFGGLRGCQFTALVECSISSQGRPRSKPPRP